MILVTGAGGFIGGHLVARLLEKGETVRAIDLKPAEQWHQFHREAENRQADLRHPLNCSESVAGCREVYNLACDMGGIGFIESHKAATMLSVLINTNLIEAARAFEAKYFYSSSACVYPASLQRELRKPKIKYPALPAPNNSLRESDAYDGPGADPEDGYGWEKLFSERMCRHYHEDHGLEVRVGRFHNSYGPMGTWRGGREKAPAAICRKVAEAKRDNTGQIEIWGDGKQTRSFMWIGDNLEGIDRLMEADYTSPVNVGSSELVTINQLVDLVEQVAEVGQLERIYQPDAPQGVRGRNSDNALMKKLTDGWEPSTPLSYGLASTYEWIERQVTRVPA